ncbi:hypothetical protein ONS95_002305 [Cadophora gregata]|uniref:uncharacterized protein n=1 Tax=Cadophora gregata TaxID=51156 RepID=UPI0026DC2DDF|nr:uncharacterized protein ONS95_002305 [Cadophora gregata]KAK0109624.1 hypothetical protein ONS95_002305 [Cadophora gregata]KAK0110746.1 hypothetical protein ONS96_002345 [Cadophora gregata f. sp. sojae]
MRSFNSAGWLALLALISIVSSYPRLPLRTGVDTRESFDEYITQVKDKDILDKRLISSTCKGLNISLSQIATQANKLCDAAISSIKSKDDTEVKRFVHFFGPLNDNDNARDLISYRYNLIKETLFSLTLNLVCLPTQIKDGRPGVIADVESAGQGSQATVRLFKGWFDLPDTDTCGPGLSKASVLVHESSHVFGATDRGPDQANDAYQYGDFSASAFGKCTF